MRTFTKEYREKHRNTFLKMYNPPDELWMFYMGADTIVISNKGRVKNLATGKIFKCHPNQQGYIMTNIKFGNGTRRSCMVHRLVAETFIPLPIGSQYGYNGYEVNHMDGNKKNNQLSNLEWVTREENLQHARDNNLFKNTPRRLSNSEVSDIIEFKKLGFKIREIAQSYKITERYVSFLTSKHNPRRIND